MDLFMQSDVKKSKNCEGDGEKILLLQVKMDKVSKEILDFPNSMKTEIEKNKKESSDYFNREFKNLKDWINRIINKEDMEFVSEFRKKSKEIIMKEMDKIIKESKNPLLIDLFESKIKTLENLYDADPFNKKVEDKINSTINSEIKQEKGLKRNKNLTNFIKGQFPDPSTSFENEKFIEKLEDKINSLISDKLKPGHHFKENKNLVEFIKQQIPLPENFFEDLHFNEKLINKIETLISKEVKDSVNLKKIQILLILLKNIPQHQKN